MQDFIMRLTKAASQSDTVVEDLNFLLEAVKQYNSKTAVVIEDSFGEEAASVLANAWAALMQDSPVTNQNVFAFLSKLSFPKLKPWQDLLDEHYQRSPASSKYHLSSEGGLFEHTLNVMRLAASLSGHFPGINKEDAVIAAYLHDIGKLGRLSIEKGQLIVAEPYYIKDIKDAWKRNESLPDHVELGQFNLMQCLRLNPDLYLPYDVWLAITYHNGAFNSNLKWPIRQNQTPLMVFVHVCDYLAAQLLETG